jgi:uncharacterized integral membrane protein
MSDDPIEPTDPVESFNDTESDDHATTDAAPVSHQRPRAMNARTELPFGLIAFLLIAVLLVIFTVQNSAESVTLKFLGWEGAYPLALIIIGVVAVTVILDEILGLVLRRRRRRRLAEKQELRRLREMNR